MKLRISAQSIRFRLSEKEVTLLHTNGAISEIVVLGMGDNDCFFYRLSSADETEIKVQYEEAGLSVMIPREIVNKWATNQTEVGFEANVPVISGLLQVLVEKDFNCLHK